MEIKSIKDLIELLERLSDIRHSRLGLLVEIVLSILIVKWILSGVTSNCIVIIICLVITAIVISLYWYHDRQPPKVKKGKVGFIVCISCTEKDDRKRIKEDFIDSLRRLIKRGPVGRLFDFVFIPQHIAENILDTDAATELKNKCGGHYMVWGNARKRNIKGEDTYALVLEGLVSVVKLPKEMSKHFTKEFSELFPRKILISTENDMFDFELTSERIEIVSKYIIGIAAHIAGDLKYANDLFSDVNNLIKSKENSNDTYRKIEQRLPKRFHEITLTRARYAHNLWSDTHKEEYIAEIGDHLSRIDSDSFDIPSFFLLKAIYHFLHDRNIKAARDALMKCPLKKHIVWHMNMAFLLAYENNLKAASREYTEASKADQDFFAVSEIQDFILWILETEPDKFQFHYCLGIINMKIIGDSQLALRDFRIFIESDNDGKFPKEVQLSEKYINRIQSELK